LFVIGVCVIDESACEVILIVDLPRVKNDVVRDWVAGPHFATTGMEVDLKPVKCELDDL